MSNTLLILSYVAKAAGFIATLNAIQLSRAMGKQRVELLFRQRGHGAFALGGGGGGGGEWNER